MDAVTTVRRPVRWFSQEALGAWALRRAARAGDPDARYLTDPARWEDPYPSYEELRARGPLAFGAFTVTSVDHGVCRAVLRSEDFGVQPDATRMPGVLRLLRRVGGTALNPIEPPSLLAVDPPDHTRYRRLVTRAFTPRAIAALRVRTEQVAADLLDALAAESTVDLVERYAARLPVTVISELLAVPAELRPEFLRWGGSATRLLDLGIDYRTFRRAEVDIDALHRWMLGHFDRLRRDPGPDILSTLVTTRDEDGSGLSDVELSSIAMLLLVAGFETTVNLIGNGVVTLLRHRDALDDLAAEPDRWPNAVEEILRYESPVQRTLRIALRDTEVAGRPVRANTFVLPVLAGANRDPDVFTDPGRFDVRRRNAREHLAFSGGIHFCLGAALARMEGEVALRRLFERHPDLALAGVPRRRGTRTLRGYAALPVTLRAVRTRSARA